MIPLHTLTYSDWSLFSVQYHLLFDTLISSVFSTCIAALPVSIFCASILRWTSASCLLHDCYRLWQLVHGPRVYVSGTALLEKLEKCLSWLGSLMEFHFLGLPHQRAIIFDKLHLCHAMKMKRHLYFLLTLRERCSYVLSQNTVLLYFRHFLVKILSLSYSTRQQIPQVFVSLKLSHYVSLSSSL